MLFTGQRWQLHYTHGFYGFSVCKALSEDICVSSSRSIMDISKVLKNW